MKKKILICGTTNFLIANFIRYILYRTKEYEIISVDNLENTDDIKRIYFNKNHNFYIGDYSDLSFMNKLLSLEKPDYIICGEVKYELLVKTAFTLRELNIPVIMLLSLKNEKMNIPVKDIMKQNTTISIPNNFGMRQRPEQNNVAEIIRDFLINKYCLVSDISVPWVYAEDVASLIWYLIDKKINGDIIMPPLGYMSKKDIFNNIKNLYKIDYPCEIVINDEHIVDKYYYSTIEWKPDYTIEEALDKTIRWFDANRWSL